jgi:mersacidin/lichenicidin family type 2 lantibiotic
MLNAEQIIRAWKDESYRMSLSAAERASLPENPAGLVEIGDAQLEEIAGGAKPTVLCTWSIICDSAICKTNFTCSGSLCPTKSVTLAVAL